MSDQHFLAGDKVWIAAEVYSGANPGAVDVRIQGAYGNPVSVFIDPSTIIKGADFELIKVRDDEGNPLVAATSEAAEHLITLGAKSYQEAMKAAGFERVKVEEITVPLLRVSGDYYGSDESYRETVWDTGLLLHLKPDGSVRWSDSKSKPTTEGEQ